MAQSESVAASPTPLAPLPFESFLATEDPVWVWDGKARRIIWANAAAMALWGDEQPEKLKRRRLSKKSSGLRRMTEFAQETSDRNDSVETLAFPTKGGEKTAQCYLQRLVLAQERPGLVVRVLSNGANPAELYPVTPESTAPQPKAKIRPKKGARRQGGATRVKPSPIKQCPKEVQDRTANVASHKSAPASRDELGALAAIAEGVTKARQDLNGTSPRKSRRTAQTAARRARPEQPAVRSRSATAAAKEAKAAPRKAGPPKTAPAKDKREKAPAETTTAARTTILGDDVTAFLAQVSHEIRNPLTIIMGFAELLQGERLGRLPPEKIEEYASDIYRTAQFALVLANDILTFAEQSGPEEPPRLVPIDINTVVLDSLQLFAPIAKAKGVRLGRRLTKTAPLLKADDRSIRQILLNLLMNAIRHGNAKGSVRVMTRIERNGDLLLSVKDDGPGMSAEKISLVLDPQAGGTRRKGERRGLGLRLVSSFIKANGGRLDIASKPGQGSDIRITFPADRLSTQRTGGSSAKSR